MPARALREQALGYIAIVLIILGVLLGQYNIIPTGGAFAVVIEEYQEAPAPRVWVVPRTTRAHTETRLRIENIRHDFGDRFSADIPFEDWPELMTYAKISPVRKLDLHELPRLGLCGNDICDDKEIDSCLQDCPQFIIRDCSPKPNMFSALSANTDHGKGTNIVIIDTGFTPQHLDLTKQPRMCIDTTGIGATPGCQDESTNSHGTMIAGIIAADGGYDIEGLIGIAPQANLFIIKACKDSFCYEDDVIEALDYAIKKDANIISMSFGSDEKTSFLHQRIIDTPQALYIASVGNKGPQSRPTFPAAYTEVIGVGALDDDTVAWFSSREDLNDPGKDVEVVAQGINIESTAKDGCYAIQSGTSFSSAIIAGIAAASWDQADGFIDGQGNAQKTRSYLHEISADITKAHGGGAHAGMDPASGYGTPIIK